MRSIVWPGDIAPSQPFGATSLAVEPLWNGVHWHCGIDVPMPVWTVLNAARAGRVAYIGYGLLAIEVGAFVDWYVHIESAQVALGVYVKAGDFVAYSGAKVPAGGSLTGPHLHFEVQLSATAQLGYGGSSFLNDVGRPGNLNYPPTSVDPVSVLAGLFGAATGSGGSDLTPERETLLFQELAQTQNLIEKGTDSFPSIDGQPAYAGTARLPTSVALLAAIQAITAPDLSAVVKAASDAASAAAGAQAAAQAAAQAVNKAAIDIAAIRARVEKDLA